jgi:HrpA-like RNA helicase
MKDEIVKTIATNQVTVISGDTGCGKTTQVPQLVLDDMIFNKRGSEANIIVTQPRRISAIGVSERIASERCERVGETTGYSIRGESKRSAKTRLLLCTTGILLRRLQCDPDLASVSHVFVDEVRISNILGRRLNVHNSIYMSRGCNNLGQLVANILIIFSISLFQVHERDLNTDFLLIILKDLLARRKSLKVVLMSATLNADTFSSYFRGCPTVTIPGRTHPVKEHRLEGK